MYSTTYRVNGTEAHSLNGWLGFGPANQIILVTLQICQILRPVLQYHLAPPHTTKNMHCQKLNYYQLDLIIRNSSDLPSTLVRCRVDGPAHTINAFPIHSTNYRVNGPRRANGSEHIQKCSKTVKSACNIAPSGLFDWTGK